jgi:hypothetical protein
MSEVRSILCERAQVYVGQRGRPIYISIMEHRQYTRLDHPDKSTLVRVQLKFVTMHSVYQHPLQLIQVLGWQEERGA